MPRDNRYLRFLRWPNRGEMREARAVAAHTAKDMAERTATIWKTGMLGPMSLTNSAAKEKTTAATHTHSTPLSHRMLGKRGIR